MSEAIAVLAAYAAVAAIPGPNLLLVAHAAALRGLRGALPHAAGAALGVGLVAAAASLLARAAPPVTMGGWDMLNAASTLLLLFAAIRMARPIAKGTPAGQAGLAEGFRIAAVNPVTIAYFTGAFTGPLRDSGEGAALVVVLASPVISFTASLGVAAVLAQPPLRRRLVARQRSMRIAVALLLLAATIQAGTTGVR